MWGGGGGQKAEFNGILLQFEFGFRNGVSRTLALQSFRITHVINTEICAKLFTTRNKNKVEKNHMKILI